MKERGVELDHATVQLQSRKRSSVSKILWIAWSAIPRLGCNFFLFTGKIDENQKGLLFLRIVQCFLLVYREKS